MFISQDKCCVQSRSVCAGLLAKTVTLEDDFSGEEICFAIEEFTSLATEAEIVIEVSRLESLPWHFLVSQFVALGEALPRRRRISGNIHHALPQVGNAPNFLPQATKNR